VVDRTLYSILSLSYEILPFDASEAFKRKISAQFFAFHRNPEQKMQTLFLADAFFKDLSNAYNNSKP